MKSYIFYFLSIFVSYNLSISAQDITTKQINNNIEKSQYVIIYDCDAGWDDWVALSYLLKKTNKPSSDYSLMAVVVNGVGEAHQSSGIRNMRSIVKLGGLEHEVPVLHGADVPVSYSNMMPPKFRASMDDMLGIKIPQVPERNPWSSSYEESLNYLKDGIEAAHQSGHNIVYISVGGLSTIKGLMELDPDILKKIKRLSVMGGAFDFDAWLDGEPQNPKGNIQDFDDSPFGPSYYPNNYQAEWNFFLDPKAANDVLTQAFQTSGLTVKVVPLNATRDVELTADSIVSLQQPSSPNSITNLSEFVYTVLDTKLNNGGVTEYIYDPIAAMVALNIVALNEDYSGTGVSVETKWQPDSEKEDFLGKSVIEDKDFNQVNNILFSVTYKVYDMVFYNELSKTLNKN